LDNRAFNGDLTRNPFNFQHFSLSELAVYLDGQQHGIKPLSIDFANRQYVTSFMSLFNGTGKENRDLSPSLSEDDNFNLIRLVTVRLDMKFATALPHTLTVVAYAEFENIIEIDRNRNVIFDFNN
jgi:hypothetical protein